MPTRQRSTFRGRTLDGESERLRSSPPGHAKARPCRRKAGPLALAIVVGFCLGCNRISCVAEPKLLRLFEMFGRHLGAAWMSLGDSFGAARRRPDMVDHRQPDKWPLSRASWGPPAARTLGSGATRRARRLRARRRRTWPGPGTGPAAKLALQRKSTRARRRLCGCRCCAPQPQRAVPSGGGQLRHVGRASSGFPCGQRLAAPASAHAPSLGEAASAVFMACWRQTVSTRRGGSRRGGGNALAPVLERNSVAAPVGRGAGAALAPLESGASQAPFPARAPSEASRAPLGRRPVGFRAPLGRRQPARHGSPPVLGPALAMVSAPAIM